MSTTTRFPTGTIAIPNVRPFGWRDKLGYLFGDLGNDFVFLLASSYLMVFYTNVAGLNAAHVGVIFLGARLLDAFTDIGWGRFLDRHRASALGRFRAWIIKAAVPLVVVSALLYAPFIADWEYGLRLGYAAVTYLLWGSIFYTMVNISYGSLAGVMSIDPAQRASLSVFRAIGANVAGLFVALVPPLFIYATIDGVSQTLPMPFFIVGIVFAAIALVYYVLCFTLVRERVSKPSVEKPVGFGAILRSLSGNRALFGLMATNLSVMLASLLSGTMAAYLWLNYFNDGTLSGPAQLASFLPALLLAPVATWLARRFGKRETIVVGMFLSAAIFIGLALIPVTSPWAFIGITVVAGFGLATFTIFVWAMIGDVIDYEEVRSGERNDGTVYAINTWARKVGLALAGGLGGFALAAVGFESGQAVQTADTVRGIYLISTLAPGVLYAVAAVFMLVWYPLGKRRVAENVAELEQRRDEG